MNRSASISDCGRYRWWLRRDWYDDLALLPDEPKWECVFVGLNPSIADSEIDDATVRIWIAFARKWGYTGFWVVNLFPLRATDPKELRDWHDGEAMQFNFQEMYRLTKNAPMDTIVCWGANKAIRERGAGGIDRLVLEEYIEGRPQCFGVTKDGYPRHPLRLPLTTQVVPYRLPMAVS